MVSRGAEGTFVALERHRAFQTNQFLKRCETPLAAAARGEGSRAVAMLPVICDTGSGVLKAGFAGDYFPRVQYAPGTIFCKRFFS